MKKYTYLLLVTILFSHVAKAQQFTVNADLRARFENRNGYGTLKPDTEESASFISQRTRLIFDYSFKNIKLVVSPQNVRTWGDALTNSKDDIGTSFHEAYGEVIMNEKFAFKVGRQEINYDDARIFGNVDWAMQARSHDAFLLKFMPNSSNKMHIGVAYNANKETNFEENYALNQYKSLQYAWYNGTFKDFNVSALLLNNGMPYLVGTEEKVDYSQTIGTRIIFKNGKLNIDGATYLQTGQLANNTVNANYFSANINYKASTHFNTSIGFESLSGKDQNDTSTDVKSFNPLYGTNHKFNGYMDYFYVGNHVNSVGLTDIYATLGYEKNKFSAKLTPHYFASAAAIYKTGVKQDSYLGTELDFTLDYKMYDYVIIDAGFSQMFATTSMEVLKGGNKNAGNNWAFLSIKINPNLFTYKAEVKP
ncbi:alginate export family protein [Flavobacterium sp. RSB2_4_14]|uniref:alginate export family protein n=1 Tax=Flavobacterium sp. RSB2_4_14 TaxID=3447665 RepID=UPI003F398366